MKKTKSIVYIVMILLIISTRIIPAFALESKSETLHISNAQDLIGLSEDSSIDSWSQGKTILLDEDIDLKGIDFLTIPIFKGTFDGQGHTIRGLSITIEGSNQGLFRYLQEDGIIKNLSVEGVVIPIGEKSTIGGIVGKNAGIIENCKFSGFVKGKDILGGLVGWNSTTGTVKRSSFNGAIYGESKVGGIAGYNAGTVISCSNNSNVNTTVEEEKLELSEITLEDINLSKIIADAIDIGGIVGLNIGIIENSKNNGEVGYPHVGYNVGGIVGRQSGFVTKCFNYGNVYGRKEVAGIVGQIEPHISTIIGSSKLKELQKKLNALDSSLTKMMNNTKGLSEVISMDIQNIKDDIEDSKSHAQSLVDQTEEMIGIEIDKISSMGADAIDKLIPITEVLANTIGKMSESIESMKKALQYISEIIEESPDMADEFDEEIAFIRDYIEQMEEIMEVLNESYSNILKAIELLLNGETAEGIELFWSALQNIDDIVKEFQEPNIDMDLKSILDEIIDMIESMGDTSGSMGEAIAYMLEGIESMEDVIDDMEGIFQELKGFMESFTGLEDFDFKITDDVYEKTKEDLFGSINEMSNSLEGFMENIELEGNKLMDDMESVSHGLFSVMNLMFDIIEEISSGDALGKDIVKDVSRDDIEKKTEGKVSQSKNLGTIEGDLNIGGIAGGMSIELLDPEVDLNLKGKVSYNTIFETRAIISRCENRGNIIGKKNGVGGIVGNMELGYIKDCIVSSSVESIDGHYVGGIAGKSDAPIVSSYARCTLDGGNYIGGIAGLGKEITDSYTLIKINRSRACVGAIAGDIDENNNIESNYFVSDMLRGIDGISYRDKAEPISYRNLMSTKDLPTIFLEFKLNFWADDKIIDVMNFKYGDSISEKDFPEIPSKEGYYGKWEELDNAIFTFDTDVFAVYSPYLTILESREKRNGILPIVLVEGSFTDEDFLILTKDKNQGPSLGENATQLEQWNLIIPEDGSPMHTLRFFSPEDKKNIEAYILEDGDWSRMKFQRDGKYLVFETRGDMVTFSIVDGGISYIKYVVLITTVVFIILISIIFIRRSNKKKQR